jgi:hypothetical protein
MNFNAIIAVLEIKGIITRDEGEALVELLNNKPQSTALADAVEQINEVITADPSAKKKESTVLSKTVSKQIDNTTKK